MGSSLLYRFQGLLHCWLALLPFGGRGPSQRGFPVLAFRYRPSVISQSSGWCFLYHLAELLCTVWGTCAGQAGLSGRPGREEDSGSPLDIGGWRRRPGDAQVGDEGYTAFVSSPGSGITWRVIAWTAGLVRRFVLPSEYARPARFKSPGNSWEQTFWLHRCELQPEACKDAVGRCWVGNRGRKS